MKKEKTKNFRTTSNGRHQKKTRSKLMIKGSPILSHLRSNSRIADRKPVTLNLDKCFLTVPSHTMTNLMRKSGRLLTKAKILISK